MNHLPDPCKAIDTALVASPRRRHADVLEWLLFLNSYPDVVYKQVSYGDKDTFELAFALAEKHADFYRILQWPRAALCNITEVRAEPRCTGRKAVSQMAWLCS